MRKLKSRGSLSSTAPIARPRASKLQPPLIIFFGVLLVLVGIRATYLHHSAMTDIQVNHDGANHDSFVQPLKKTTTAATQQNTTRISILETSVITVKKKEENLPREESSNANNDNSSSPPFPLAKSLLNVDPPFQESDIIELSPQLSSSPNTVVTGYFRVSSKYNPGKYDGWMSNMLSLQDHMIIFTQQDLVEPIKQMRSHALDKTVIVVMKLDDLPIGKAFPIEFWESQLAKDPERKLHKSYQLFWIWLSKSWCVTQAIRMNFFQSDLFMWSDIGCFRNKKYNGKTMIQHRNQVPKFEMMQMAHHPPNPPDEVLFNDKYKHKPNFYHSGSQAVAFASTWLKFHELFLATIDKFIQADMIIVEDQAVLQSVCLQHPEICVYVPYNQVNDNHYFGLRYVLHSGNNPKLWRHPRISNSTTVTP